jgi:hypothetical protein
MGTREEAIIVKFPYLVQQKHRRKVYRDRVFYGKRAFDQRERVCGTLLSADFWSSLQPLMEMARPPLGRFGFLEGWQ